MKDKDPTELNVKHDDHHDPQEFDLKGVEFCMGYESGWDRALEAAQPIVKEKMVWAARGVRDLILKRIAPPDSASEGLHRQVKEYDIIVRKAASDFINELTRL